MKMTGFDLFPLTNETNLIAASKDVQSVSNATKKKMEITW